MYKSDAVRTPEYKLAVKFNEAVGVFYRDILAPVPVNEIAGAAAMTLLAHLRMLKPSDRMGIFEEMVDNTLAALREMHDDDLYLA